MERPIIGKRADCTDAVNELRCHSVWGRCLAVEWSFDRTHHITFRMVPHKRRVRGRSDDAENADSERLQHRGPQNQENQRSTSSGPPRQRKKPEAVAEVRVAEAVAAEAEAEAPAANCASQVCDGKRQIWKGVLF